MEDEELTKTLEQLINLAENLAEENETLRQQNKLLAEKVLLMEQTYQEEHSSLESELIKAHNKSLKNNQIAWIVPKIGKA
tara:strand:- start:639 stop:878 length:240 start_codon:yes stop_codon:yes gene_type:complete